MNSIMVKTWILAASAVVTAVTLIVRWRRQSGEISPAGESVSAEWLSNARGQREDNW